MSFLKKTDFVEQVEEISHINYPVAMSRNKPSLDQTKRNNTKRDLMKGLTKYLTAILDGGSASVYQTADGVAIEVPNDFIYAKEKEMGLADSTNGTVTFVIDITMQNLSYDAYEASEIFAEDQAKKEAIEAEKAKKLAKRKHANENEANNN